MIDKKFSYFISDKGLCFKLGAQYIGLSNIRFTISKKPHIFKTIFIFSIYNNNILGTAPNFLCTSAFILIQWLTPSLVLHLNNESRLMCAHEGHSLSIIASLPHSHVTLKYVYVSCLLVSCQYLIWIEPYFLSMSVPIQSM